MTLKEIIDQYPEANFEIDILDRVVLPMHGKVIYQQPYEIFIRDAMSLLGITLKRKYGNEYR